MLDPAVVVRIDGGERLAATSMTVRGASAVARQALTGLTSMLRVTVVHPALVNGAAGVVITMRGRPVTVMAFAVSDGKIVAIDSLADPDRVPLIAAGFFGSS